MFYNAFEPTLTFISDYLTGWTIILFIIFIIYFIALRKYYINKEQFYYSNINEKDEKDESNDSNEADETNEADNSNSIEAFANPNLDTTNPTLPNPTLPNISSDPILNKLSTDTIINTTLFDNLKLLPEQVKRCKTFYNSIIINYISEFTKLLKLIKTNKFLNIDKQVNIILIKGVDNIITFLNNDIKSMNILTRNSIKTDLVNITSNTIEYLIDKENINLTYEINELAKLNSTTIDYTSMVKNIDVSRNKIENYIQIDNLLSKYGQPNSISQNKTNKVLDKSFILPIYERNFDRITQLVNSDFNDDYTKLSEKYGKAYTDYLNQKKKEDLNVNPLEMLSKIESGVVNFLTNSSGKSNSKTNNSVRHNDLIEQYNSDYGQVNTTINESKSNPLPKQNTNLINDTTLNKNNIYKDSGNLGNYLINNSTQKELLEGFVGETSTTTPNSTNPNTTNPNTTNPNTTNPNNTNPNTTNPNTTNPNTTNPIIITTKPNTNTTKNKKQNEDTSIIAKLFSGEFLDYVMDVINVKLNIFYTAYYKQFSSTYGSSNNTNENENSFKLDEHLIPAGFLLFILSMLFYFIDLTS
jgi:hypothetical protein